MDLVNVILRPLFSEKSYQLKSEEIKKYVFEINKNANKYEIALAFQMIYGVVPEKINIVNRKPTPTRTGTRKPGMTKFKKIAYITLPKGVDIAVEEEEIKESKTDKKENKKEVAKIEKEVSAKPKKGVLSKLVKTSPKAK
ncbi:MAG: 50S ribosomal protein L23 [Malacoplasma sp.]|nr:50S ribosomal protein L23 [Malacoplasma sp.]